MPEELIRTARELWPDAFGGARQEGERLVIAFTRDPVALGAELRRRTGQDFRLALSRFAERELEDIVDRIESDRALRDDAGIRLVSASVGVDRVRLQVVTEHPAEAMALVAERYGPAVALEILGPTAEVESLRAIEHWAPGEDDRALRLAWQAGGAARLIRIELDESADAVSAGAVVVTGYFVTADSRTEVADVRLFEPLGARKVIDARSGREIRREPRRT